MVVKRIRRLYYSSANAHQEYNSNTLMTFLSLVGATCYINAYISDMILFFKLLKNRASHSRIILIGLLAVPLLAAIGTTIISDHAANAQLTTAHQNAAKSLVATGYTNHYQSILLAHGVVAVQIS